MPKPFDVETNRRFMTSNASEGNVNADLLLFLTQKYLGEHVLDAGAGDGTLVRSTRSDCSSNVASQISCVRMEDGCPAIETS